MVFRIFLTAKTCNSQVPGGMKRRVLRWYDYSWSRGRIQGGGDINTALGLLPDKLKTELALHVNLSVLKKVCKTELTWVNFFLSVCVFICPSACQSFLDFWK